MRGSTKIAVVIPYYQRSAGILRRALVSIAGQKIDDRTQLSVIVVDDGSPSDIGREIDDLLLPDHMTVATHRQTNRGPAAARNAGLDLVPSDATWIAFLDSDDEWLPNHICTALTSLRNGADIYFCDHKRKGSHGSYFPSVPFPFTNDPILSRDDMLTLTLRHMPSHISTVVFRREIGHTARFETRLRGAGEDLIYIVQLTCLAERIAVSPQINVVCGDGVNIFFGNFAWDAPGNLLRVAEQVWAFTLLPRLTRKLPLRSDDTNVV